MSTHQMQVRCPAGCGPGSVVQVRSPSGQLVRVKIPAGVGPGQLFCCVVGNPPPRPAAAPVVTASPGILNQPQYPAIPQTTNYYPRQQPTQTHSTYPSATVSPPTSSASALPTLKYASPPTQQTYSGTSATNIQPPHSQMARVQARALPSSSNTTNSIAVAAGPPMASSVPAAASGQSGTMAQHATVGFSTINQVTTSTQRVEGHGPAPPQLKIVFPTEIAQPVAQIPLVAAVTNYLSPDNERVYTISVSVQGQQCWEFNGRFSELNKKQKQFKHNKKPKFADLHFLADFKKNTANVSKRNQELQDWFQAILDLPQDTLISESFLQAFQVPQSAIEQFHRVTKARMSESQRLVAAEAFKQKEIQKYNDLDQKWAQNFQSNLPPDGSLAWLRYPKTMTFVLKNKMWSFGDAVITGPGTLPYFKMNRTKLGAIRSAQFTLTDMSNRGLTILDEVFNPCLYQYTISRINTLGQPIQLATISVNWSYIEPIGGDQYNIQIFNDMSRVPIQCQGNWLQQFCMQSPGVGPVARVDRSFGMLKTTTYNVVITAGQDVILLISLACCIDRMHCEMQRRRRRR